MRSRLSSREGRAGNGCGEGSDDDVVVLLHESQQRSS
jgi:hypothetical protein